MGDKKVNGEDYEWNHVGMRTCISKQRRENQSEEFFSSHFPLSASLSLPLAVSLSVSLCLPLFLSLSVYLSIHVSIYLSIYLSYHYFSLSSIVLVLIWIGSKCCSLITCKGPQKGGIWSRGGCSVRIASTVLTERMWVNLLQVCTEEKFLIRFVPFFFLISFLLLLPLLRPFYFYDCKY